MKTDSTGRSIGDIWSFRSSAVYLSSEFMTFSAGETSQVCTCRITKDDQHVTVSQILQICLFVVVTKGTYLDYSYSRLCLNKGKVVACHFRFFLFGYLLLKNLTALAKFSVAYNSCYFAAI